MLVRNAFSCKNSNDWAEMINVFNYITYQRPVGRSSKIGSAVFQKLETMSHIFFNSALAGKVSFKSEAASPSL